MNTDTPFVLLCVECDAGDGIDTKEQAAALGWTDLHEHDGMPWTWIGFCPACKRERDEHDSHLAAREAMSAAKEEQRIHNGVEVKADEIKAAAREESEDECDE